MARDFCRRFSEEGVTGLMEATRCGRSCGEAGARSCRVRSPIWTWTIAPTSGEKKQGMSLSYKGIGRYAPLIVSLANTKEALYMVNLPGNVASHGDAPFWIDRAIEQLEPHAERICVRGGMEFRRFLHGIILMPDRVSRRARGIALRPIGYNGRWTGSLAPGSPSNGWGPRSANGQWAG